MHRERKRVLDLEIRYWDMEIERLEAMARERDLGQPVIPPKQSSGCRRGCDSAYLTG